MGMGDSFATREVSETGLALWRLAELRGMRVDLTAPNLPEQLLAVPWGDKQAKVLGLDLSFTYG